MEAGRRTTAERTGFALVLRALSLSLGAAIALGIARFSYALLLPPMKADLGWSFAKAGALNTGNAIGYLVGALVFPLLSRRFSAPTLFLSGCAATSLLMAGAGYTHAFNGLLAQRIACGFFSAMIFVAGGVLATRLANLNPHRSGLALGLYYSGAGWGIAISALVVPFSLGDGEHGWQSAWIALALACALCSVLAWPSAAALEPKTGPAAAASTPEADPSRLRAFAPLLIAYGLFGVGYIGYMTFVIALLRSAGLGPGAITGFYITLGLATAASAQLWSGLLHRARGGGAFAWLSLMLALATLVPALTSSLVAAFASGIVFGGTFLSVVTSTTAFVRHNLSPARWSSGISTFTTVFALGQIVGPVLMGRISDGSSLSSGFLYSAIILFISAAIAAAQRPLS